jgi:hypothetical protein
MVMVLLSTELLDGLSAGGSFVLRYNTVDTAWYKVSDSDNLSDFIDADTTDIIKFLNSSAVEQARINASGHILIGKTEADTATAGIALRAEGQIRGTVDSAGILFLNRNTDDGILAEFRQDDSAHGSISISGSTTAYNTSSDYRLKENVADLTGATDRLKQIPVKQFNFISNPDKTVDGFLAHEVQAIVPEAVTGAKDAVDVDGAPVYQQIDQAKLVPLLVATIKELEARIEALEV